MINRVKVIGLCGKARSGKDTFARMLADELNRQTGAKATIMSLALPIKSMLANFLSPFAASKELLYVLLYGDLKEMVIPAIGKSPRQLMQTLGTEWGRDQVRNDVWLVHMKESIRMWERTDGASAQCKLFVVIPDIRFNNEAPIADTIYRIERDDSPTVAEHPSEQGIFRDLIDRVVVNNTTKDSLRATAKELAAELLNKDK